MKFMNPPERDSCEEKHELDQGNMFLYVESKRAKMKREKELKQLESADDIEFSPQELALATVPGRNFDPRECKFTQDDLRPQPIIRKRKKVNLFSHLLLHFLGDLAVSKMKMCLYFRILKCFHRN